MAEYTQNYNLKKPAEEDFYNVKDFNDNADIIDQALKAHDDALATKETPQGAQEKADAALNSAKQYTDQEVGEVAQELAAHKAELATQDEAGHIKLSDIPSTADDIGAFDQSNYGNVVTKTGSFTLSLSEKNAVITVTAAATINIPNNDAVALPIGTQITVIANTTGNVTFVPASGVTLYSKDTKRTIDGQHASASLIKTSIDIWQLIGALK